MHLINPLQLRGWNGLTTNKGISHLIMLCSVSSLLKYVVPNLRDGLKRAI